MKYLYRRLALAGLLALSTPLHAAPGVFWTFGFDFPHLTKNTKAAAGAIVPLSADATADVLPLILVVPNSDRLALVHTANEASLSRHAHR